MIYFLVTIDTEEEGLWGSEYKRHLEYTVENIRHLVPFQKFCNEAGIRPTYLIDYPVATTGLSVEILRNFVRNNNCEIGAHLHPWCNPPYEEELNVLNSYTNNLPAELQLKKMTVLTEVISENLQIQPISYRAGRYGFDHAMIPILESLGYKVDSSVVPLRKTGRPGEPVFDLVSLNPYRLDYQDVCRPGDSSIVEIPITVGFTRRLPGFFKRSYNDLPSIGIRRLLKTLLKIDLVWLRPSYSSLEYMKRLVDNLIKERVFVFNMMFHSTELMPGASKYNRTVEDVEVFMAKIKGIIHHLTEKYPVQFVTLKDVPALTYSDL
ncbi:MAG: polysaccharide deacetylase family protein [Calditrichia bacterium]